MGRRGGSSGGSILRPVAGGPASATACQADLLPTVIRLGDDPAARPVIALVVGKGTALALHVDTIKRVKPDPAAVAEVLAAAVREAARSAGGRPRLVEVRNVDVADRLGRLLAADGIDVRRVDRLRDVEAAAASLAGFMGERSGIAPFPLSSPETWAGWDLPDGMTERIFAAAARFHRAAPWRLLDNLQVIRAARGDRRWLACVMGNGGREFGLALYSDASDFARQIDDPEGRIPHLGGRILSLTLCPRGEIPPRMRKEIQKAGWEVAGPRAYPLLHTIGTLAGGLTLEDAEDLLAILDAIPRFVEAHREGFERPEPPVVEQRDEATGLVLSYEGRFGEPAPPHRDPLHEAYDTAFGKLMKHAFRRGDPRTKEAFDRLCLVAGSRIESWEEASVSAYVILGHRAADGRRAIDRFLDERRAELSPLEVEAMEALRESYPSLFEVEAVRRGEGFDATDLVTGERILVHEVKGSEELTRFDLYFGWVIRLGGRWELTGAGFLVPRAHREPVLKAFLAEAAAIRRRRPGASAGEVFGEAASAAILALRRALREMPLPLLYTTDGDEMLFCETRFSVRDPDEVRKRLAGVRSIKATEDGFVWLARRRSKTLPGAVVRATLRFDGGELVLEAASKERLERAKEMLGPVIGDLVHVTSERIDHPKVRIAEARSRPKKVYDKRDMPPGAEAALVGEHLRKYYAEWLDQPIPALGGKTPRQAVRSKSGKYQVIELLKDIENSARKLPGGETVDFDALRRELGLARGA